MRLSEQILATVPGQPLLALEQADQRWLALRQGQVVIPRVVTQSPSPLADHDWDVIIAGGTLGIFIGVALAQQGWRVALWERGQLQGRVQEWNISRRELAVLVNLGLLTTAELEVAIATEFNPVRVQFHGGDPVWVRDVLNLGVSPRRLLAMLKTKFLAAGGHLREATQLTQVTVHPNGVVVQGQTASTDSQPGLTARARLLIDAMGHGSPIVQQARQGQAPDSVCLVVGTCATGYPKNSTGDLMVSLTPAQRQCQYFWEAFPAEEGRTAYLFTYLDPHPDRCSLADLFDDYFQLLPHYQGVSLTELKWQRALMGCFPCYRQSPLQLPWGHILPMGDSSSSQSPLSFGGFGALLRHLQRLSHAVNQALREDALTGKDLRLLQPYQPSLSVTWLFQRAMSIPVEKQVAPEQINQLLNAVFAEMARMGDPVLKPFLQDVVQFSGLSQTLLKTAIAHPRIVLTIIPHVGLPALAEWLIHYWNLGLYTLVHYELMGFEDLIQHLPLAQQFRWQRWREAICFGSGQDFERHSQIGANKCSPQ